MYIYIFPFGVYYNVQLRATICTTMPIGLAALRKQTLLCIEGDFLVLPLFRPENWLSLDFFYSSSSYHKNSMFSMTLFSHVTLRVTCGNDTFCLHMETSFFLNSISLNTMNLDVSKSKFHFVIFGLF